jgi:hypothetical protein
MAEELDKPLLDPENFNREGIDLVGSPSLACYCIFNFSLYFLYQHLIMTVIDSGAHTTGASI